MAWVKMDDQFFLNRKARAAGLEGRALAAASWCYCAIQENDGEFPVSDIPIVAAMAGVPVEVGDRLIEVGLWHAIEGDRIQVHDYLKHNPSRQEIAVRRERAEKAAAVRHATSSATSRPASNATSQPLPSPSPDNPSRLSSSSDLGVPEAVWTEYGRKKLAQQPAGSVRRPERWLATTVADAKGNAELAARAGWLQQAYQIDASYLADCLVGGTTPSEAYKRKDGAA